jgi:ABC-type transporter Mla subunit MlaD
MIGIMSFYIYFIYNNQNESISKEQKADSCYYLGFILTLIAMINTLIELDVDNIENIFNSVVRDFGLALVTTIVGLVARIIWLQLASANAFDGEETIRDKLIAEAQELETQTQRITGAFTTLAADAERVAAPLSGNLNNLSKTLDIPSELSATLHQIATNADELKVNLANLNMQTKAIDLRYFDELSSKFSALNLMLERLTPIMESNIENLNRTFEKNSKSIEDYNRSLGSLLDETKKTYREVNHSLRDNAEYIKNELK